MSIYGLIIGLSFLVGISYFQKHADFLSSKLQNIFISIVVLSSVIGARLYHVLDYWDYYSQNPWQIPQTWNGGLGIYGGLLAAIFSAYLFSRFLRLNFLRLLDTITPILPLCQAIGRLGNFDNHEIPTWWLEASLNVALYFLLKKSTRPTSHYLIGYGLIRFFLEFFRSDTWTVSGLKIAQIISLIFIAAGLFSHRHNKTGNK